MNKDLFDYQEDGFCFTDTFTDDFIKKLKKVLKYSNFERFRLGNTEIKIYSLDFNNTDAKFCLKKVIEVVSHHTKIKKTYLEKNFTNRIYVHKDDINSRHRNQIFHYDSYPSTKLLRKINFLRYFYVPGKFGVKQNKEIKEIISNSQTVVASNNINSGVIFNTDTLHSAEKITKKNFTRINVRFDFKQVEKSGVYLDKIYTRFINICSRVLTK
tara:strand:+ start:2916 stop:3554 length:639 start_codon:yes stop_codon:yes gene_type:complete